MQKAFPTTKDTDQMGQNQEFHEPYNCSQTKLVFSLVYCSAHILTRTPTFNFLYLLGNSSIWSGPLSTQLHGSIGAVSWEVTDLIDKESINFNDYDDEVHRVSKISSDPCGCTRQHYRRSGLPLHFPWIRHWSVSSF